MSKELEAFYDLLSPIGMTQEGIDKYLLIETALKRLEKYDDEELEYDHANRGLTIELLCRENHKLVKEHKALEIIKKKKVNVAIFVDIMNDFKKGIYNFKKVEEVSEKDLSEEEIKLLKEVLLCGKE